MRLSQKTAFEVVINCRGLLVVSYRHRNFEGGTCPTFFVKAITKEMEAHDLGYGPHQNYALAAKQGDLFSVL